MKKLLAMLLLLAVVILGIASCDLPTTGGTGGNTNDGTGDTPGGDSTGDSTGDGEGDGGAGSNEPVDYGTATVYTPGTDVQIIATTPADQAIANKLRGRLDFVLIGDNGGGANVVNKYAENAKYEIVLNMEDETRPATVMAQRLLERMDKDSYFMSRVVVYADSGCIAFAYDVNEYTNLQAIDFVVEEFIEDYIDGKDYVAIGEGIVIQDTIDLIAEQEDLDRAYMLEKWKGLETLLKQKGYTAANATKVVDSLSELYSQMYDDKLIEWMANLYDPGVGGYYQASSGRDTEGYGPDVESTVQLIRFIVSSGMVNNISTDPAEFLPKFMQQQMIYFAKSLQSTNGYFYHPQWADYDIDTKYISRRGRDLGWATSLLDYFDKKPPYKAANGKDGDGVTADEYWDSLGDKALSERPHAATETPVYGKQTAEEAITSRLGTSVASAVSKVVAVADTASGTEYLQTHTAFLNYLFTEIGPGMDSSPYSTGNKLNATYSQIATWSGNIGAYTWSSSDLAEYKAYDGMTLKEMTIAFLNSKINPAIGLWGIPTGGKTGVEFAFTNGWFKVMSLYNNWGFAYPAEHIVTVANTLMNSLISDEPTTGNACDVYNVWCAIGLLKSNIKLLKDSDFQASENPEIKEMTVEKLRANVEAALMERASLAIDTSLSKMIGYKKPDGGFSHSYTGGPTTNQGLPTAVGIYESGVDATCICSTGLINNISTALGINSNKIPLYTESDWMRYLEILLAQQPVVKYSYDGSAGAVQYHDFEADIPSSTYLKFTANGEVLNTFVQKDINGDGVGFMNKQGAKQGYFDVMPNISSATANYVAWESDIMFNNVTDSGNRVELRFYAGKNSAADRMYVLYINVPTTKSGGNITIQPAGASEAPVTVAKLGEWFTLRYEYFGGNDSTPASFKVYINDMKTPVIVDYKVQVGSAVSASTVKFSRFITMNAFKGEIYFDDMSFVQGFMTDYVQLPATHNKDVAGSVPGGDDSGSSGGGGTTVTNPVFNSKPSGNVTFDDLEAGRFNPGSVGDLLINQIKQDNATTSTEIVSEGDIKYLTMNKSDVSDTSAGQTWLVIQRNVTGDDLTVPIVFEASMRHTQIKNTSQTYFRFYEGRTAASGSDGTKIGGNLNFTPSGDSVKVGDNVVGKLGEWFTLRFVIVGTTVSIYANDENGKMVKLGDHTHGGDLTKISTIVLMNDTTTLHKTDFNYIYFGRNSDLAASADPLYPVTPNASSGGTTETPDTPAEAPKGPMSFDAIAEGDFALDTSRDSVLIGKANHSTDVVSSLKIVSDGDNKYLFFDKEENAPDANGEIKNRMCWLVLERTEEAGADGVLYFEAKLNLTSKNTNTETHIRFYNGRTAAKPGSGGTEITSSSTRPGFYVKDGKVYINKVEIGAAGEWITVRLAMGAESTTVYVLDAEGKWVESSTIAVAGLNATTSVQLTMNTAGANTILLDDVYFGPSYSDAEVK